MTAERQDQLAAVTGRKSSFSGSQGDCVEIAGLPVGGAAVPNPKGPDGAALTFTAGEWAAFLAGAKAGEFG